MVAIVTFPAAAASKTILLHVQVVTGQRHSPCLAAYSTSRVTHATIRLQIWNGKSHDLPLHIIWCVFTTYTLGPLPELLTLLLLWCCMLVISTAADALLYIDTCFFGLQRPVCWRPTRGWHVAWQLGHYRHLFGFVLGCQRSTAQAICVLLLCGAGM